jgi:hypothetical protein
MRIRHPVSFILLLVIIVLTAAITTVWNVLHGCLLIGDVAAIILLSWIRFWEGLRTHRNHT